MTDTKPAPKRGIAIDSGGAVEAVEAFLEHLLVLHRKHGGYLLFSSPAKSDHLT